MTASLQTAASALDAHLAQLEPPSRLAALREALAGRVVLTTSFGLEDQVLTHLVAGAGLDIEVVTLDTGRLFPETYALWAQTEARYGRRIAGFYPERPEVEALVRDQGIDGFYNSLEARKACCHVRKVVPLGRALEGASGWVTGLRADQSPERTGLGFASYDAERGLVKVNPLYDWTRDRILDFALANDVPINPLHAKSYLSIGCAPCTRAIAPGEPERAGRWWWEDQAQKECGLHVAADGRLVRSAGVSA
ncbi:MAG: phosphoadenosine phosphosulfate reductase [Hyphomicrobiales bacterium]|nr:phosphoadenosine phosphosulfate reductase [Hyphomicrobiales bacterium]